MSQEETPRTPESTEPTGSAAAPEGGPYRTAGAGRPPVDFAALGGSALRILKDPAEGLGALHRPGQQALIQGLILGVGSAVLIPLVMFLALKIKIGSWYRPAFGDILESCLGGVAFVAAGVAVGYILRGALAKGERADWRDDLYLFGSPMVFLLAGIIVGSVCILLGGRFLYLLSGVVGLVALLSFAFTYQAGLAKVAKLDSHRSICIALSAIAVALVVGTLLKFPVTGADAGAGYYSAPTMEEGMEDFQNQMESLMKGLQDRSGGGVR
jgi:hypothetical protein